MMTNFICGMLLICVAMTSVFGRMCPTGCSCRGPPTDRHTAICFKDTGPSKDFPSSIKTLEIRHVSAGSMQRYLKHAPDVTDLIIHDSDSGDVQYLPPDFFHGMKNIKALTFQKLKHNVAPQGLATAMNGLSKLRFLDLTKNQLECSCELLDWVSTHHVMLLGVRNLSPSTHCQEAGLDKDTYTSHELINLCGSMNSTHIREVKHTLPESSATERSKVTDGSSSSKVENEGENQDNTEEEVDWDDEDEDEDEEDFEDNQEVENPESVTVSQRQPRTQAPFKWGEEESVTITPTPEVTTQSLVYVSPDLKKDVKFLKSEFERTNLYRDTLIGLLDTHKRTPSYSTQHPLPTLADNVSNSGTVKPTTTPQETQSPDGNEGIDYYDAYIESILTTSAMKIITTPHPSYKNNPVTVSEHKTNANFDQGRPLATLPPPLAKTTGVKSTEGPEAEHRPSNDSKHLFLDRSSSGGLGSSILDGPVDIRLRPIDPVELEVLIKYLQGVSDAKKAEH